MIRTEADQLLDLLATYKKMSTKEAAKMLGMNTRTIEEWADFFEKKGLIHVKFNPFSFNMVMEK